MKKTILFITTMLLVLCIVPISTTLAIPQQTQGEDIFASTRTMDMELHNPEIKADILTYDSNELREIMIAQGDTSTATDSPEDENPYVKRSGNNNPYVKRRGHGRSTMGNTVVVEDDKNSTDDGAEDDEGDVDDDEYDELPNDNSAIKYNKGLNNSSGYNEDL